MTQYSNHNINDKNKINNVIIVIIVDQLNTTKKS